MGTRHLIAVMSGGEYRLAQYGQWDGYPEGQGRTALAFCREHLATKKGQAEFAARLRRVRFAKEGEVAKLYEDLGIKGGEWISLEQGERFDVAHPYFSRDHGAKILQLVWDATGEVLTNNSIDFAGESLFCEWAYVVDLDKGTLEVFEGFNQDPLALTERFAAADYHTKKPSEYHPVKLDDLPSEEAFLAAFKSDEDEEAAQ